MPYQTIRLVGLCLLAGAVACDVKVRDGKASFGVFRVEAVDDWTHTHPLAAGGRVEIVNVNGPVDVTAAPATSPRDVEIHATITAKGLTDAGARELLAAGRAEETVEPARVRVETISPRAMRGSFQVHYQVRVPPDAITDISTTNGAIRATGLEGAVRVAGANGIVTLENLSGGIDGVVANGAMTVTLARMGGAIRLEVTNGRLSLALPAASAANLSAQAVNGSIETSGLPGVAETAGRRIQRVETMLNGGGPDLILRATNGRISVTGR